MLVNLKEVLSAAQKGGYGVGLFNTTDTDMLQAVIDAAEELNSPVIVGTAEILLPYGELKLIAPAVIAAAKRAKVPVVVHYDHGLTEPKIMEALRLGFSSIMYDCSTDAYENNVRRVARMVEIAHLFGATVEGELGHVGANETGSGDEGIYTQPEQARDFVERTGVDALAVAIGTAHGAYKEKPKLDIGRLSQIAHTVSTPLVLHGGSGLSDEDFRNCVANGICKVNIFTDINCAAARAAHDGYQEGCGLTDLQDGITQAVKEETMKKMRVFGSAGRG